MDDRAKATLRQIETPLRLTLVGLWAERLVRAFWPLWTLAIAVLACARIGAIHSVVFAGFSSNALATRINDCDCKMVITSDGSYRGGKTLNLKGIVDAALEGCPGVETVLVVARTGESIKMDEIRDHWLAPLLA